MDFAKVLRITREERKLSQQDLALKAGLDRTYVYRLEKAERNPSIEIVKRLSVALDIELSYLIRLVGQEG